MVAVYWPYIAFKGQRVRYRLCIKILCFKGPEAQAKLRESKQRECIRVTTNRSSAKRSHTSG